ncbi:hypothetical protein L7F22_006647 [Adiantum nelumboides]|nr:hypothetical protein [Adiantum nelumboides]
MQAGLPYGLLMCARKVCVAVFSGLDCVKLQCKPSEHTSASRMVMRLAIELANKSYDLLASSNASRIIKQLANGCSKSPRCIVSALYYVKSQRGSSEHPSASRLVVRFALELAGKSYELSASSNASCITNRLADGCSKDPHCVFSALNCIKLQRGPFEHPSASRITIRLALELVNKPYDLPASSNARRLTVRLADGCCEGRAYRACPQRNARNEQPRASIIEAPKEDVHCKGSPLSYAWGKVREHDAFILFDPGSTHNFISLELAAKLGIQEFEMGDAMKADGAFIGQDVSVTPLIGKLRLHIQGYVDKEDFFISPLKHEDVILGAPWFDRLAASIKFPERRISFKFREKNMYIDAQESGNTIPLVHTHAFDKSIKSSISVYMIFIKDSLSNVNKTQVNESGIQEDLELSKFLNQFQDVFIDNIPRELPSKRGDDDHAIELISGRSPPNKPPYRVSQAQQEEVMRQVNELVEKGMVEVLITKEIINEPLQFIPGAYDLIPKTKAIDNEKAFLKVKGSKFRYSDLIYSELELPLMLISQHLRVQKPPRSARSKKSSSEEERTETDKEQDFQESAQEKVPKETEASIPSEYESDEEDTSVPLERKGQKPRSREQVLMDEAMAGVEAQRKELVDARAAKAAGKTKPMTMEEARKIKIERAKALQEERRRIEAEQKAQQEAEAAKAAQTQETEVVDLSGTMEYLKKIEREKHTTEQRAAQLAREKIKEALSRKAEEPVLEPTQGSPKRPRQEEEEEIEDIQADPIPPSPINIPPAPPSSPITPFPPKSIKQRPMCLFSCQKCRKCQNFKALKKRNN